MRIAWITYDFEEYSVRHVNEMAAQHDVLLVIPEPQQGEPVYEVSPDVDLFAFEKPRLRQPIRQWRSISRIVDRVREFQPDVIHYQQGHLWFNAALRRLRSFPLVITIHDPRHHAGDAVSQKTPQFWMDYGFRQADHVIVHGDLLADQVHELFGFERDRIHVIPHLAMGDPNASSQEQDRNCILFFGRIWEYKGLDVLIRAQPLVTQEHPDARFVIAGEGEDFARYEAMIQNPDVFEIHNRWISDEERADFFSRSNVVVLPYNEATQSGVVPVAYNHQRAVVATKVGALQECVEDEVTGLLVPPRSPQALANAISRCLSDPSFCTEMGKAGYRKVTEAMSPAAVAEKTLQVYRRAVGEEETDPCAIGAATVTS